MAEKELLIGPFLTSNGRLALIGLDESKIHIIILNWVTQIKYSISIQLPLFLFAIENILNKSISELNERHNIKAIDYLDIKNIKIVKSKMWKNHLLILNGEEEIKYEILERHRTFEYDKIFEALNNKLSGRNK